MTSSLSFTDLLTGGWKNRPYQPFRDGIDVCYLHNDSQRPGDPVIALLRYAIGASVPLHKHVGVETIIVLEGTQSDESGCYPTGSLIINPVGSQHSVWSDDGCVVFIQWDQPVQFL